MASIHPTAIVDPKAELADSVSVGAFTTIGPNVRIGEGTTVGAHCVIEGVTTIGSDNTIYQFASLGADPQDKKYKGEPTQLIIGDFAMLGFQTRLSQDLPPFVVAAGNPAEAQNVHQEGPRRRGYSPERLANLKAMYKLLCRKALTLAASVDEIAALKTSPDAAAEGVQADIDKMLAFLADAKRGIVR